MPVDWNSLRDLDGSQRTAFEELCCQLAAYEPAPKGSDFVRKGAPDAGVECYWKLPSGDEWGWQAKFFISSPGDSQWNQLDASVKTALKKHPRLVSYTVCLPIDRQDPRINEQQWFMDKWNERIKKWKGWAKERGMTVDFCYLGEHEIWERLSREEHRGRYYFWFNKELFSKQWFKERIEEAIANAGPRYSPELNVSLPISFLFDGIGRTTDCYNRISDFYGEIKKAYRKSITTKIRDYLTDKSGDLQSTVEFILSFLTNIQNAGNEQIEWNKLIKETAKWPEVYRKFEDELSKIEKEIEKQDSPKDGKKKSQRKIDFDYERYHVDIVSNKIYKLAEFAHSNEARLFNNPTLLLIGEAGSGKTHLFCDVAERRDSEKLPTIFIHGGQVGDSEPWSQVIQLLGLQCTRQEFLSALEAAAQARGARAIILIDALNEGEGRRMWHNHLSGMFTTLSRYPWIGLAISVRTSYEEMVISEGLVPNRIVREVHYGFSEHEDRASSIFFEHFGIRKPSVPLLIPEFTNPLFLKVFCEGLRNMGMTSIPLGFYGVTKVFIQFIDSINLKLSNRLDFDKREELVQKAVQGLAEEMANKGSRWMLRGEASRIVNSYLPDRGHENSLFNGLISEGILSENRYRVEKNKWQEGIHFSYERFSDHMVSKHLLDKHLNPDCPEECFQAGGFLNQFLENESACYFNQGLLCAFSIQIPERINKELADLAPKCSDFHGMREAFVESLIWRDPKSMGDEALRFINKHVIKYSDTHDKFLNAIITLSSIPDHPYNAHFLHKNLIDASLAERDTWWSIFLHDQYGQSGPIDRLVEWAESPEDRHNIGDDSIFLCGMTLSWFLTTSDRYLRDRATKGLVRLLANRIPILVKIMESFIGVNDPYVIERIFAVAYGCAMRTTDKASVGTLAKHIYDWIFKEGTPPIHILLRDYARGVIEIALYLGLDLNVEVEKIRPPYKSDWPTKIPSKAELEKKYDRWDNKMMDGQKALYSLYNSVMGFSDFARYIIGTNSGHFEWSSRLLSEPWEPTKKEIFEEFEKSLPEKEKKLLDNYQNSIMKLNMINYLKRVSIDKGLDSDTSEKEMKEVIEKHEESLRSLLRSNDLKTFENDVISYLKEPYRYRDEHRFDLSIAQRWIFQRVMDLGWTPKRFGEFDFRVNRYGNYGRGTKKPERIGKKYQWIAYHEFLAMVSDNFEFRGRLFEDLPKKYEGPWQISVRDIDPSCLLKKAGGDTENSEITWWSSKVDIDWDSAGKDLEWLKKSDDLPSVETCLEVNNPTNNSKWLVLEGFHRWEEPVSIGEERFDIPRKDLWYMIKSYIVKKEDFEQIFEWAKKQNFMGRWMPESSDVYKLFLGEFFWSLAYKYINIPYYYHEEWTRGSDRTIPKEVLVTSEKFLRETGYDCSIEESIHLYLPCRWLCEDMRLNWKGNDGCFYNNAGELIAFDPSVSGQGSDALLINRKAFLKFLKEEGYALVWTILGEKIILGHMLPERQTGRLEISGAYTLKEDKIEGHITTSFSD